jgi:hypothetical protein
MATYDDDTATPDEPDRVLAHIRSHTPHPSR